jgi:hypothetical protein
VTARTAPLTAAAAQPAEPAHAIALGARATALCGSPLPDPLKRLLKWRLVGPIHFASLDGPGDVLAQRLRERPASRGAAAASSHGCVDAPR